MAVREDFLIHFALTSRGTVLAASNEAPFFCFEGATQEEVEQITARALHFFEGAKRSPKEQITETFNVTSFIAASTKKRTELVE